MWARYLTVWAVPACLLSIIVNYNCLDKSKLKSCTYRKPISEGSKWLLIGVVSGRDNYLERGSIRETWARLIDTRTTLLKFIVGSRFCQLPLQDRRSPYGCRESAFFIPRGTTNETLFETAVENIKNAGTSCYTGFTWGVVEPVKIVIRRLGVINWATNSSQQASSSHKHLRVVIKNSATGVRQASATFVYDDKKNLSDIIWKRIPEVGLRPGFEGEISLENYHEGISPSSFASCSAKINLNPGVIEYFDSLKSNERLTFDPQGCHLVAFSFTLEDVDSLNRLISEKQSRKELWMSKMIKLNKSLQEESDAYGDILLLDVVDVYHNLSTKVQFFFDWAVSTGGWKYILKTDDDVFLDVRKLYEELARSENRHEKPWDIWSCFKSGWPIPRSGKWRAPTLAAGLETYPDFPSGAGYIIRGGALLKHLVNNTDHLDRGEDVRLGIAIDQVAAGVSLKRQDAACQWSCDISCRTSAQYPPPCNIQQLTAAGVYLAWQQYQACQRTICQCIPHNYLNFNLFM